VRVLLDTHILLWWLADDGQLPGEARELIATAESAYVSTASVWEISIKQAVGKLTAPDDLAGQISRHDFALLPIHLDHAIRVGILPLLHRDPFDRMLVAQAQLEGLAIVTGDPRIARYDVPVVTTA
jgi:PIN domain nuclease of toxin-antitoxin system